MLKTSIFRKEHFNAAHRLFNPEWDEEKNFSVFGKCSYPNYHGHNYEVVVKLTGYPDEKTGYVYDLKRLSDLVDDHIIKKFDHKNLNLDTKEFKDLNPTAENIARVIHDILREKIEDQYELKILLYETERNFVQYPAD